MESNKLGLVNGSFRLIPNVASNIFPLSETEKAIIIFLSDNEKKNLGVLDTADRLGMDKTYLIRLAHNLMLLGLVSKERDKDHDARKIMLRLTVSGIRLVAELKKTSIKNIAFLTELAVVDSKSALQ